MKSANRPKTPDSLPQEVQFKMALDYLYREAAIRGWDLTASLIGAASDSIAQENSLATEGSDLGSCDELFFVPNTFGAKPN